MPFHEQESIPTPSFKVFGKAMEIPIVNDAIEVSTKLHAEAVTHPYVNQVETIIGGLVTKAEDTITPCVSSTITSTVTSTATQLDTLACTNLDQVTAKVPALKLPSGELATATTDATLNLANTIVHYVAKVVRVIITAFVMVLGFAINGLEILVGLLEGKVECPATITTAADVVKPVIGHINTFKVLLEEFVKRNAPTLNFANTIQEYVTKFAVVRVLITALVMVRGFAIQGLETVLGLLEGKPEMCRATITTVVKLVIGNVNSFKVLLEEIVERNAATDVTKHVEEEKPKEE